MSLTRTQVKLTGVTCWLGKTCHCHSDGPVERMLKSKLVGLIECITDRSADHHQTSTVAFTVTKHEGVLALRPGDPRPLHSEWYVSWRGAVQVFFSWDDLDWTQEVEDAVLGLCNRVCKFLRDECC